MSDYTLNVDSLDQAALLQEIADERHRQDEKWGPVQDHPNILPEFQYRLREAGYYKFVTDTRAKAGKVSYTDILLEEVAEAIDEAHAGNVEALRKELMQVAAVAVKWVENLDGNR